MYTQPACYQPIHSGEWNPKEEQLEQQQPATSNWKSISFGTEKGPN